MPCSSGITAVVTEEVVVLGSDGLCVVGGDSDRKKNVSDVYELNQ